MAGNGSADVKGKSHGRQEGHTASRAFGSARLMQPEMRQGAAEASHMAVKGKTVVLVADEVDVLDYFSTLFPITAEALGADPKSECISYRNFLSNPIAVPGDILVLMSSRSFTFPGSQDGVASSLAAFRRANPESAVVLRVFNEFEEYARSIHEKAGNGVVDMLVTTPKILTEGDLMLMGAEVIARRNGGSLEKELP